MKLKITSGKLGGNIVSLDASSSLSDLLRETSKLYDNTELEVRCFRFGYPPQTIHIEEDNLNKKLDDFGISSGERVAVEFVETSQSSLNNSKTTPSSTSEKLDITQLPLKEVFPDAILQLHKVPDDNSCLFHAISYCVYKDISLSPQLREIVSREIQLKREEYSDAILGRPNGEYAKWILNRNSWGGGIEIAILSNYMNVSILVLDMDVGHFEKFNEEKYEKFIIVVFSGVHYDALEIKSGKSKEPQTVFDRSQEHYELILNKAQEIAKRMKKSGYSFNTHKDKIKCNTCHTILTGEKDVARHAEQTGHVDFGQSS